MRNFVFRSPVTTQPIDARVVMPMSTGNYQYGKNAGDLPNGCDVAQAPYARATYEHQNKAIQKEKQLRQMNLTCMVIIHTISIEYVLGGHFNRPRASDIVSSPSSVTCPGAR